MRSKIHKSGLAKLARTYRAPAQSTDQAIYFFLSSLDCPRSLAVWLLYKSGDHDQIVGLTVSKTDYPTIVAFRDAYTATEFLSKSSFLKLDVSKKAAALSKFEEFEEQCKRTNTRFRDLSLDPSYKGTNAWLLNAVTCKIAKILGDISAEDFVDEANWGPGVSTLLKGEHVSAVNKFHSGNGITRDLYALVRDWFPVAYPLWGEHLRQNFGENLFAPQVGNVIVTVPKNAKTDRVIAIEPDINLWFQKAIGSMIRRRLSRHGIDLRDQTINQRLAREGSFTGLLATVDFSSASDSISRELVREVLPPDWFNLMDACRSKLGVDAGTSRRWEKFSSMGNGFTFELESLIFFAAAVAVREFTGSPGEVSVYGDDVIIPSACFDLFSQFSSFLGFSVNAKKSFHSSGFRESCGAHYYWGSDCKPIFLKEKLTNVQSLFKLANSIRNLSHRHNYYRGCDSRFRYCWSRILSWIPGSLQLGIPVGFGDGGLVMNFDEATPVRARHGIEGFLFHAVAEVGVTQHFEQTGLLLARLKTVVSEQAHGNNYTLRGRTKCCIVQPLVQQWYNLGPWE